LAENSSKVGLEHCRDLHGAEERPEECGDYFEYTNVPWDWLVDLSDVKAKQRLLSRWNLTDSWLEDVLGITENDTYILRDVDRNDYGFQDFIPRAKPVSRKYLEYVYIPSLANRPERLLQLGTLFGSSRLHLRNKQNSEIRRRIRQAMTFTNPHLVAAADAIRAALGSAYLGAHIRIGDGLFEEAGVLNVRLIWWKLLLALGFDEQDITTLERTLFAEDLDDADPYLLSPPYIAPDIPSLRVPHPPLPPLPTHPRPPLRCPGPLHTRAHLARLNTPLFLATDAPAPRAHPALARIVQTFPCTFVLADFGPATAGLGALTSAADGVRLAGFLGPFLDAMVAGCAWAVVGTEGSTFSAFVGDVLWRTYHGWEIVQRG
ncbi:hypothetical protein OBBRIDRAFT_698424, partial [Obba rivulosa]